MKIPGFDELLTKLDNVDEFLEVLKKIDNNLRVLTEVTIKDSKSYYGDEKEELIRRLM